MKKERFYLVLMLLFLTLSCSSENSRKEFIRNILLKDNEIFLLRDKKKAEAKFIKMSENPYYFMRGSLALFMADQLDGKDIVIPETAFLEKAPSLMLIGDPHMENIGTILKNGNITVDFNDFDSSNYGPLISDLRRFAVSLYIAASMMELNENETKEIVSAFIRSWIKSTENSNNIEPYSIVVKDKEKEAYEEGAEKKELKKYTYINNGYRKLLFGKISDKEILRLQSDEKFILKDISEKLKIYGNIKSSGRIIGKGVSSIPLKRYLILTEGPSISQDDDIIFDVKEVRDGISFNYQKPFYKNRFKTNGERLEFFQKTLLGLSKSSFPQSICYDSLCYKIQQFTYYEQGIDFIDGSLPDKAWNYTTLKQYAEFAGNLMCNMEKRGESITGEKGEDIVKKMASGNEEKLENEITEFAILYGYQTIEDYELFNEIIEEQGPLLGWNYNNGDHL